MAKILNKPTEIANDSIYNTYHIFQHKCPDYDGHKCVAHREKKLTGAFDPHKICGIKSMDTGKYVYVSFMDMNGVPFNPLTKGFDLSKFGDEVEVFGEMEINVRNSYMDRRTLNPLNPVDSDQTPDKKTDNSKEDTIQKN